MTRMVKVTVITERLALDSCDTPTTLPREISMPGRTTSLHAQLLFTAPGLPTGFQGTFTSCHVSCAPHRHTLEGVVVCDCSTAEPHSYIHTHSCPHTHTLPQTHTQPKLSLRPSLWPAPVPSLPWTLFHPHCSLHPWLTSSYSTK